MPAEDAVSLEPFDTGTIAHALMHAIVDGVITIDTQGTILAANDAVCRTFGYARDALVGRNISVLASAEIGDQHDQYIQNYMRTGCSTVIDRGRETTGRRADGTLFPIRLSVGRMDVGGAVYFVGVVQDVSDRVAAEQRAAYLESFDTITGLMQGRSVLEEANHCLAAVRSRDELTDAHVEWLMLSVNIDGFRSINNGFGHSGGDKVLRAVSQRLSGALDADALVGRFAADEFLILSPIGPGEPPDAVAERLAQQFEAPFDLGGSEVRIGISIGACVITPAVRSAQDLLHRVQIALQSAKKAGGSLIRFYQGDMSASAMRHAALKAELALALERHEFRLVYQPVMDLSTGKISSVEALLRWQNRKLGTVSPAEFVPVLEESGMIAPVTGWLIEAACRQIIAWSTTAAKDVKVFINLSPRNFANKELDTWMLNIVKRAGVSPSMLGVELTESLMLDNAGAVIRVLTSLGEAGVEAAIDDFGTGYSSLSYLRRIPAQRIKIDRSFVMELPNDEKAAMLVRATVGMSHGLGMKLVAEGVETEEQRQFLTGLGADYIQGYLLAKPTEPVQIPALVEAINSVA